MEENKCRIETISTVDLYEVAGGDDVSTGFGIMLGLAFIAGATGLAAPLAGALIIGGLLAAS